MGVAWRCRTPSLLGLLGGAILFLALPAWGGGLDQLHSFLAGSRSGKADFTQTVQAKGGRKAHQSAGSLMFVRPGKFRWSYDKPYPQLLVGDGEKLWIYDKELNQVTVKKLGQALGNSPAALLAGDNGLERNFTLKESASEDGLEWVEAVPKSAETGFERVRIGFKANLPVRMELADNFGQTTRLVFERFQSNPALDASSFRFVPPKGADVMAE